MKWLIVVLLVALTGTVYWVVDASVDDGVTIAGTQDHDAAIEFDAGSSELVPPPQEVAATAEERSDVTARDVESKLPPGIWLDVTVTDLERQPIEGATVRFAGVVLVTSRAGRARRDVSGVVRERWIGFDLNMTVTHPDYMPETQGLKLAELDWRSVQDGGHVSLWPFPLTLRRPRSRVFGQVVVPEGVAPSTARVALLPPGEPQDNMKALAITNCLEDGSYELLVEWQGNYTLIAFVPLGAAHPAHVAVRLPFGETHLEPIVLSEGHTLHGTSHLRNGDPFRCGFTLGREYLPGASFQPKGIPLRYEAGHFKNAGNRLRGAGVGEFTFKGLHAGDYKLSWWAEEVSGLQVALFSQARTGRIPITIPREEPIAIVLEQDVLLFRTTYDGKPIRGVSVKILGVRAGWSRFDADDQGQFAIIDDSTIGRFEFSAPGYKTRTVQRLGLQTTMEHWNEIELEKGPAPASVTLVFVGDSDRTAESFKMRQWRYEGGKKKPMGILKGVQRADGELLMEDLDPGNYAFEFIPHVNDNVWPKTFVLPVEVSVRLKAGESSRVDIPLKMGGRLEVMTQNLGLKTDTGMVRFKLMDGTGAAISLNFGRETQQVSSLSIRRPSDARHAIPEGNYIGVVSGDGIDASTHAIRIIKGETTTLFADD